MISFLEMKTLGLVGKEVRTSKNPKKSPGEGSVLCYLISYEIIPSTVLFTCLSYSTVLQDCCHRLLWDRWVGLSCFHTLWRRSLCITEFLFLMISLNWLTLFLGQPRYLHRTQKAFGGYCVLYSLVWAFFLIQDCWRTYRLRYHAYESAHVFRTTLGR